VSACRCAGEKKHDFSIAIAVIESRSRLGLPSDHELSIGLADVLIGIDLEIERGVGGRDDEYIVRDLVFPGNCRRATGVPRGKIVPLGTPALTTI
jgi:hypothetical protein